MATGLFQTAQALLPLIEVLHEQVSRDERMARRALDLSVLGRKGDSSPPVGLNQGLIGILDGISDNLRKIGRLSADDRNRELALQAFDDLKRFTRHDEYTPKIDKRRLGSRPVRADVGGKVRHMETIGQVVYAARRALESHLGGR